MTTEQRKALKKVYNRLENKPSYLSFRRKAQYNPMLKVVFIPYAGMVLGIESDGYTHS